MAVRRRSTRTRNILAVLVLAALTLVTIDARSHGGGALSDVRNYTRDVFSPLQRATHAALDPVGNFLTGAVDYGSLRKENEKLRAQVAQMETQAAQAQSEVNSAEQIEAEQNLTFLQGINHVTAPVVDNPFSNFELSITIGKGTSSGIAAGEPVVSSGGLVGQVQSASATTAVVKLITDPDFAVGVDLQGDNVGTATGQGLTEPLRIDVDTTSQGQPKEKVGDVLVTSGLSMEEFPKAIPVAKVTKVTDPSGAIEPSIEAEPIVKPSSLAYVDVLIWTADGYQGDG